MMMELIREAKPGDTVWDRGEKASQKGLHLKVTASGQKNFYFYYRTRDRRERRPKIGTFGEITLTDARRRAKALADKVALGEDPKGLWDEQREEWTVEDLFQRTFQDHWNTDRFKASGWARQVTNFYLKNLKTPFGSLKLSEVTPLTLREWQKKLSDRPYAANRSLEILGKMFNHAESLQLRPQGTNPCALVTAFPERKRRRYASEAEIKKIAAILDAEAEKRQAAVAFLYLLFFTGSRPRAIERATWDQLEEFTGTDGQTYGLLTFEGKTTETTGEYEKVVLPPQAMRVISKLPRIKGFTITGIKMPRRLWNKIKQEVGCQDLWARDLRRTFATVGMSSGINDGQIGELLNHKTRETTKIYAKLMDRQAVQAATQIAGTMESLMRPKLGVVRSSPPQPSVSPRHSVRQDS